MGRSSVSTDCTAVVLHGTLVHSYHRGLIDEFRTRLMVNEFVINSINLSNYIYLVIFSLYNFNHTDEYQDIMYFYTNAFGVNIPVASVSSLLPNSVFSGTFQCFSSGPLGKLRYNCNQATMVSTHTFAVLISTNHCIIRRCRTTLSLLIQHT
jgi:hypothetical protein